MISSPAPIVVGVIDGPEGQAALRFALHEAVRRGSPLDVVTAWTSHSDGPQLEAARESTRAHAQEVQDVAVAEAIGEIDLLPVLSRQVVEGDPAQVLLKIARTADYLVVGSSRKSVEHRALLGSVSEYCVRQATCPVLVVPTPAPMPAETELLVSAHE